MVPAGFGEPYTSPYISLFGFCILFGMVMNFTRNRTKMSSDTLIGVYLSISIAVGACILIFVTSKINMHLLDQILFGSILTVNNVDMMVLALIATICVVLGGLRYNQMLPGSQDDRTIHRSLAPSPGRLPCPCLPGKHPFDSGIL